MSEERVDSDEATAVVRWLLEAGVDGRGLTKTHALGRATVREAAERWPHWWSHDLLGPPQREADLPVLEATHAGLRRARLMRRQRETLCTTARGRALLANADALLDVLHEDLRGGEGFDAEAWVLIEEALHVYGPLPSDALAALLGPMLRIGGWRDADGAALGGPSLLGALHPLLWRAEGYGLVRQSPRAEPLTFELTTAGHRLPAGGAPPGGAAAG